MKYINKERVGLVLVLVALLTNPLSGAYAMEGVDRLFVYAFQYVGAIATAVAGVYVICLMLWYNFQNSRIKIPNKAKKTNKLGRFIET